MLLLSIMHLPQLPSSGSEWIAVVVEWNTGVRYCSQCAGLLTLEKSVEGYLVPVMGAKFDAEQGHLDPQDLTRIFHEDGSCHSGQPLSDVSVARLRKAVADIPFWSQRGDTESIRGSLRLDEDRLSEAVEAWVPVLTSEGRGVLVWLNCD